MAWLDGRVEEALATLEQAPLEVPYRSNSIVRARTEERYLRGELLNATGRPAEALGWYPSAGDLGDLLGSGSRFDLAYLAPSQLRRAEIYERLGDHENALLHYNRFIELWKDADPELQPRVEAARRRLAQLAAEGT